ncbi:MAG: MFS transporter [Sphingomicrobium sp.]
MSATADRPARPGFLVGLLLLAYIFNFLDRQLLAILKIPIKAELHLSDTQLGLMGGIAFASVYSTLAIPFARIADRSGRVRIIAAAVAVWSLFTALCGLGQSFWQLFAMRMGVGVGEAGGVAPSYALIADSVPVERRARSLGLFSLGIPFGSALGLVAGAWLTVHLDWRYAFAAIGLTGLPIAWAIRRLVPDAPHFASGPPAASFAAVAARLAKKPSFWLLSFGAASASICGYGLAFWLPSYFVDDLHISLTRMSLYFGSIVLVGGTAGIYFGGLVADRLRGKSVAADAAVPAIAFLLTAPLYVAAMTTRSLLLAWPLFTVPYMLSLVWLGPILSAVQRFVPPAERATASACFLLINNLIGIGFGTFIFGFLSDRMKVNYGATSLHYAMLYGLAFYVFAALFCALAATRLKRDIVGQSLTETNPMVRPPTRRDGRA